MSAPLAEGKAKFSPERKNIMSKEQKYLRILAEEHDAFFLLGTDSGSGGT